jgi:glycosyltransferase involved in cell wall biosynthesis
MNIFHLLNTYALIGGIETYVLELLPLLEKRGHENYLVYRHTHPRTPSDPGKKVFHVPVSGNIEDDHQKILNLIQEKAPDIVYLHDIYDPHLIKKINRIAPTVGYVHIFYPVCPGLGKLFKVGDRACTRPYGMGCIPEIYLRRCASARHPLSVYKIMKTTGEYLDAYKSLPRIIVASCYMKNLLIQNGIKADRIEVLPYFVPIPDQKRLTEAAPEAASAGILFAGRLEYEKGLPYLLKAMTKIKSPHHLVVAGDGSLKQHYLSLVREMGLSDHVQFKDWLSSADLESVYRRSTVVVMPTLMPEPFGKVGVEAMANQRPVVAFNVGGIPDWLVDGHNGFLVTPGNVEELANKIDLLIKDRTMAVKFGVNGRKFVEERYRKNIHLDQLENIFHTIHNS